MNPELQLLCRCALHPLWPDDVIELRQLCQHHLDWPLLTRLATRHNLTPLLYTNLKQHVPDCVPPHVLATLKKRAEHNRLGALRLLAELHRIADLFAAAGIVLCPLKGPALTQRLYGDVGLRVANDLDLFVSPAQFSSAEAVLQAHGYQRTSPSIHLTPLQWRVYRRIIHHVVYIRPDDVDEATHRNHFEHPIHIELHWTLSTEELFPADVAAQFLGRARPLAQANLLNLGDEDLFCFLVLHGSRHAWSQLKWLSDIAMLLRQTPSPDWQAVFEQMAALDLLRPLGQALMLVRDLFGLPIPAQFSSLLVDRAVHHMAQQAMKMITNKHGLGGGERGQFQRLRSLRYRMDMKASWRFKLFVFSQLWVIDDDWEDLSLPDWLFPLYFVLRPFLWLQRYRLPRR